MTAIFRIPENEGNFLNKHRIIKSRKNKKKNPEISNDGANTNVQMFNEIGTNILSIYSDKSKTFREPLM
jgi:hypothetical protein